MTIERRSHPPPNSAATTDGQATPERSPAHPQVQEVRERLVREAAEAGFDEHLVHDLVDRAAADYVDARVQGFIGILVERTVRTQLKLGPRTAERRNRHHGGPE